MGEENGAGRELRSRFHLALPVSDLDRARRFYGGLLGCAEGRSAPRWIDYDFFGHQLSLHLDEACRGGPAAHNHVDGDEVPVPHFGAILAPAAWRELRARLGDVEYIIPPRVRFEGEVGEQATMFVADPFGNVLEFKAFGDDADVFRR